VSSSNQTFISQGNSHKITIYSAILDNKKYPVVLFLHGNFGLVPPFGEQIQSFAEDFTNLGYVTAVPQYYLDNKPHLTDTIPKIQILTDAISEVIKLRFHDLRHTFATERVGLMGIEELRALMGHENIQTTLQYSKVTSQRAEQVAQLAFEKIAADKE
jgi:dienelactone hydrolase